VLVLACRGASAEDKPGQEVPVDPEALGQAARRSAGVGAGVTSRQRLARAPAHGSPACSAQLLDIPSRIAIQCFSIITMIGKLIAIIRLIGNKKRLVEPVCTRHRPLLPQQAGNLPACC
jgi:hypothetical protein